LQISRDMDRKLAELLLEYVKNGTVRKKGVIEPYASILWDLLDGDGIWEYVFQLISEGNRERFDSLMREQISKFIDCTADTQTSIINLFLQKKGGIDQVREFYSKWTWKYVLNK